MNDYARRILADLDTKRARVCPRCGSIAFTGPLYDWCERCGVIPNRAPEGPPPCAIHGAPVQFVSR